MTYFHFLVITNVCNKHCTKSAFYAMSESRGITLIVLIITIVVLLILAGVTVTHITGGDGVLEQAQEKKAKTDILSEKETIQFAINSIGMENSLNNELSQVNLQKALDEKFGTSKAVVSQNTDGTFTIKINDRWYNIDNNENVELGVNWEYAKQNVKKPSEQTKDNVIGIGTDGKAVNMDLWEYTLMSDDTYLLNDAAAITENGTRTSGYSNQNIINGKIQGTIPQYIKSNSDNDFKEVTNINYLFYNTDLIEAPIIPSTVTSIRGTFNSCRYLTSMPEIPRKVTNMYGTFSGCPNLVNVTNIPASVTNMFGTFQNCTSLINAPYLANGVNNMTLTFRGCTSLVNVPSIPNSVTNMYCTFYGCTSLKNVPKIPNSVTVLCATFRGCTNLQGTIEINANVSGKQLGSEFGNAVDYNNCLFEATTNSNITLKVIGTCTVIDKIVENANNPRITL